MACDTTVRLELSQFLDPQFELFDFIAKLVDAVGIARRELVFEALEPCLLSIFVHLGFPNVLGFFSLVDIAFSNISHLEGIVNFPAVNAHHPVTVDPS